MPLPDKSVRQLRGRVVRRVAETPPDDRVVVLAIRREPVAVHGVRLAHPDCGVGIDDAAPGREKFFLRPRVSGWSKLTSGSPPSNDPP